MQSVSGHPLIIGVAIDSVRRWKFEPYASKGVKKGFCGQLALRFQANEHAVKYKDSLGSGPQRMIFPHPLLRRNVAKNPAADRFLAYPMRRTAQRPVTKFLSFSAAC